VVDDTADEVARAVGFLDAVMRRRGCRIEVRLTRSGVRGQASASGLLERSAAVGEGACLGDALRALAVDLHEKGA
jgi:hypothetical protein